MFLQKQLKLQELQEKLRAEEAEKTKLANKCEEIQNSCDRLKDQLNSNQEQQHEEEVCVAITRDIILSDNSHHLDSGEGSSQQAGQYAPLFQFAVSCGPRISFQFYAVNFGCLRTVYIKYAPYI